MLRPVRSLVLFAVLLLALAACRPTASIATAPDKPNLILATTTSTQDSGLLDTLVPLFQAQSGYMVQTIAVGTGAALMMAQEGNADVLLVHAPAAEDALMAAGWGSDRWLVMHNDFVIVGPLDDPAGIADAPSAAAALAAISDAATTFISRGDDSGTHKKELSIWQDSGVDSARRQLPWYLESGQGMGSTLFIASQKSAYALTDRGTFLAIGANLDLKILFEGDPTLLNIYHVITVNPVAWPASNYDGALAFAQFMIGDEVQAIISDFGVADFGQPLFFPDAGRSPSDLGLK